MHRELQQLSDTNGGVVLRREAVRLVGPGAVDRALRTGRLIKACPRTFVDPLKVDDRRTLLRAVSKYGGPSGALSHRTALEVWRLVASGGLPVHLTVDVASRLRGAAGLRVHRRAGVVEEALVRDGLAVTPIERAVVDSWPLLDDDEQRGPAIAAVNRRMTTPDRLLAAADRVPRLGGRERLLRLLRLLKAGCRSHLELWGHERVFVGAGFEGLRWQVPMRIDGRTIYLDAFDADTGVNFELDGAQFHLVSADRERDLRRDAALQGRGFIVVRFGSARLRREPDTVRREALAVMAARSDWRLPIAG